jgi:chaperonin GroES
MRAIGTNVLLKEIETEKNEINGIAIPDSAKQKPMKYKVISIGNDVIADIEVGDTVIVGKYVGTEIVKDKVTYKVVDEEEIIAKIEE